MVSSFDFQNPSSEARTLQATISCFSVPYNGVESTTIKKAKGEFKLGAGEGKQ